MSRKSKSTIGLAIATALFGSSIVAENGVVVGAADNQAMVSDTLGGLHIELPTNPYLEVTNVRLYDENNLLVWKTASSGGSMDLDLGGMLVDGRYRFEIVNVFENEGLFGADDNEDLEFKTLERGSFLIEDGQLFLNEETHGPELNSLSDDAALLDRLLDSTLSLAGASLDYLVSSAQADVMATDLEIETSTPDIQFDDIDDEDCTSGWDWHMRSSGGSSDSDTNNYFQLFGAGDVESGGPCGPAIPMFEFLHDGDDDADSSIRSLMVKANGDIHFADDRMILDKSGPHLMLGWSSTATDMSISDSTPDIRLHDETGTQEAEWELSDDLVTFWGRVNSIAGWKSIIRYNVQAPTRSLEIVADGSVGLGTGSPEAKLEVESMDARIVVQNTDGAYGARDVFRGKNYGPALFSLKDLFTNNTWAFTNTGTSFTLSKQGSGVKELEIFNNGNAILQGTLTQLSDKHSKQDVVPVDRHDILNKLVDLEISEWSYKDSPDQRHIGPMSQDFHRAFGLGGKSGVKGISTLDSSGVALAAIQALAKENADLKGRLAALEAQQVEMQAAMARLIENQQSQPVLTKAVFN